MQALWYFLAFYPHGNQLNCCVPSILMHILHSDLDTQGPAFSSGQN